MRDSIYIPQEVKESISNHLYTSIGRAVEGYLSAHEDEDTLTGHLGALLQIGNQRVVVASNVQVAGTWTWSINYRKFRGRGKDSAEKFLGADGIFELILDQPFDSAQKSLLFQAKKGWREADKSLVAQSLKLSTWREAAFILNYDPNDFQAFLLDDVIRTAGARTSGIKAISLGAFLSRYFLECLVGDTSLKYEPTVKRLSWIAADGKRVATEFSVDHRFTIKVRPPKRNNNTIIPKPMTISNHEIYEYRMEADPEDILSLHGDYNERDLKRARKRLALSYHSDINPGMDELLEQIKKRRMQEVNDAYDVLFARMNKRVRKE